MSTPREIESAVAQVARDAAEVSLRERRSLVEASRPDSVGLEQNDLCDLLLTEHSLIGPDAIQRSTRHLRQLVRHRQCFDAVARPPPQIDDLCRTGLLAFRETTRHEQTFAEVGVLREVPTARLVADYDRPHVIVARQQLSRRRPRDAGERPASVRTLRSSGG